MDWIYYHRKDLVKFLNARINIFSQYDLILKSFSLYLYIVFTLLNRYGTRCIFCCQNVTELIDVLY